MKKTAASIDTPTAARRSAHAGGLPFRLTTISAALAGAVLVAQPALAQQQAQAPRASGQLSPIVVEGQNEGYRAEPSSPKQTAPLLDTPETFQVIPDTVYNQQGARNLTEVLRNTPGISFEAGENGFATNTNKFNLRGFDVSGNVFVDGARDSGNYSRDVFNVEQVEIAKGAAADNGRGAPGGYVNLVTKQAHLENTIGGTLGFGFDRYDSDTRKRATLDVNRVLGETTAARLNLLVENSGVPGRDMAKTKSLGLAPTVSFGLNTPTVVTLAYQHLRNDDRPDWGVPGATRPGLITYDPSTQGVSRDKYYGLASDYDDVRSDSLTARVEHRLSDRSTVGNQLRWSKTRRDARYTVPTGYTAGTGLVNTQTQFYNRDVTSITNHAYFKSTQQWGGIKHNLSAGLEFTREESDALRYAPVAGGPTDLFNPDPNRGLGATPAPTQTNGVRVDTIAAYLYDTVEFSPQWQLTGGLRAERYKVRLKSADAATGAPEDIDGYNKSDTSVNGKLGLVYKPRENGSIYGAVSISTLPPGSYLSNPDISRDGPNAFPGFVQGADPQRSYNYELGTKWDLLDKRLSTSAALFYTERRKVGMTNGFDDVLIGYGKQIVHGLELGVVGQVTDRWSVYAGAVFMSSKREHSAEIDAQLRHGPTNGDSLAFTPNVTANLWTTYRVTPELTVGGGVRYVGNSYVGRPDTANRIIPNGNAGQIPSYVVADLMASYELNRNVTLRLNIDNIADKTYVTSTNWAASRAFLGAPRLIMLSADIRY